MKRRHGAIGRGIRRGALVLALAASAVAVVPTLAAPATADPVTADMGVTQVGGNPHPAAGAESTVEFELFNHGPDDAPNAVGTITLPEGLTLVDHEDAPGVTCTESGQVVRCEFPSYAVGYGEIFGATFTTEPDAAGPFTIEAAVSSEAGEGADENPNAASFEITPAQTGGDLSVGLSPQNAHEGEPTYARLTIVNESANRDSSGSILTLGLAPGIDYDPTQAFTYSDGISGCQYVDATRTVTCLGAAIPALDRAEVLIPLVGRVAGSYDLSARVTGQGDPVEGNDTAENSVTIAIPDGVDLRADTITTNPADPVAGHDFTIDLHGHNGGATTAEDTFLVATLPPGLAYVDSFDVFTAEPCLYDDETRTVTCEYQSLAYAEGGMNAAIVVRAEAPGTYTTAFEATTSSADDNPANNSRSRAIEVVANAFDLSVTGARFDTDGDRSVGTRGTIHLFVSNAGPAPAPDVDVVDTLPAGVTFVAGLSSRGPCTGVGQEVTCPVGTLLPNLYGEDGVDVDIVVDLTAAGTGTNVATASSAEAGETSPADDTDQLEIEVGPGHAELTTTLSPLGDRTESEPVAITASVTNAGPLPAAGATLVVHVPGDFTVHAVHRDALAGPVDDRCTVAVDDTGGNDVSCSFGALAVGTTATIVIDTTANGGGSGDVSAQAGSPTAQLEGALRAAAAPYSVSTGADVSVRVEGSGRERSVTVTPGTPIFEHRVVNSELLAPIGPNVAHVDNDGFVPADVELAYSFPAGMAQAFGVHGAPTPLQYLACFSNGQPVGDVLPVPADATSSVCGDEHATSEGGYRVYEPAGPHTLAGQSSAPAGLVLVASQVGDFDVTATVTSDVADPDPSDNTFTWHVHVIPADEADPVTVACVDARAYHVSTCTVTVEDLRTVGMAPPDGSVAVSSSTNGPVSRGASCRPLPVVDPDLVPSEHLSRCSLLMDTPVAGSFTVTGTFTPFSSDGHAPASGTTTMAISARPTRMQRLICSDRNQDITWINDQEVTIGHNTVVHCLVVLFDDDHFPDQAAPAGTVTVSSPNGGVFTNAPCGLLSLPEVDDSHHNSFCYFTFSSPVSGHFPLDVTYVPTSAHAASTVHASIVVANTPDVTVSCPSVPVGNDSVCTATATDNGDLPSPPQGQVTAHDLGPQGAFSIDSPCTLENPVLNSTSCTFRVRTSRAGVIHVDASYLTPNATLYSVGSTTFTASAHTTGTAVSCAPAVVDQGETAICVATVSDLLDGVTYPPYGTVTGSAPSGVLGDSPCTLVAIDPGTTSCAFSYTNTHGGQYTITGLYSPTSAHDPSSGASTLGVLGHDPTSTNVVCNPDAVGVGGSTTCLVTVADTAQSPDVPSPPGGVVSVTASAGSVSPSTCTLAATGSDSAGCSVGFTAAGAGSPVLTATYVPAHATHLTSNGASTVSVVPPPQVTSVAPATGTLSGGTTVTITGTNLTGTTAVRFGDTYATAVTVVSATQVVAVSPAHPLGPVDVVVTRPLGSSATTAADRFTFVANVGTVRGRVTETGTGAVVPGATVRLWRTTISSSASADYATTTDALGQYELTGIVPGAYQAQFGKAGSHGVLWSANQAARATAASVTVAGGTDRTVDQALVRNPGITGRITDRGSGQGLAGVRVSAYDTVSGYLGLNSVTLSDGSYSLPGLAPGRSYQFLLSRLGYADSWIGDVTTQAPARVVVATPGEVLTADATMALDAPSAARIQGTVTDAGTGVALAGTDVRLWKRNSTTVAMTTTTDAQGRYTLANIPAGSYRLQFAKASAYQPLYLVVAGSDSTGFFTVTATTNLVANASLTHV